MKGRLEQVLVPAAVVVTLSLALIFSLQVFFLVEVIQRVPVLLDVAVVALVILFTAGGTLLLRTHRGHWRLLGAGSLVLAITATGLVGGYLPDAFAHVIPAGDAGEVVHVCGPFEFYRTNRLALAAAHRDFPGVPAKVAIGCRGGRVRVDVGPFVSKDGAVRLVVREQADVDTDGPEPKVSMLPYAVPEAVRRLFPRLVAATPSLGRGPRRCLVRAPLFAGLGSEGQPPGALP